MPRLAVFGSSAMSPETRARGGFERKEIQGSCICKGWFAVYDRMYRLEKAYMRRYGGGRHPTGHQNTPLTQGRDTVQTARRSATGGRSKQPACASRPRHRGPRRSIAQYVVLYRVNLLSTGFTASAHRTPRPTAECVKIPRTRSWTPVGTNYT